jgi:hypothetical protein
MIRRVEGNEQSLTEEELYQRLEAKRDELSRTVGSITSFPEEIKQQMMEEMLRDEASRLDGVDPAIMEAMNLIRKHGVKRARKLYRDGSFRHLIDATAEPETVARNARVAALLEEAYEAQMPRWQRRLGI